VCLSHLSCLGLGIAQNARAPAQTQTLSVPLSLSTMMQPPPTGVAQPTMPQQAQQYPQQPYMMMPPPAAPAQAPPPMWAQQQVQPHQAHQPAQPTSADEVRTLWIGDLQYWMDENYLFSCFAQGGEVNKLQPHPTISYLHAIFYLCYWIFFIFFFLFLFFFMFDVCVVS
jgi:hypothetical protein